MFLLGIYIISLFLDTSSNPQTIKLVIWKKRKKNPQKSQSVYVLVEIDICEQQNKE